MGKSKQHWYMDDLICPSCDTAQSEPYEYLNEGFSSGDRLEAECEECGISFGFSAEFEVKWTSWEAPCLNGGEHDLAVTPGNEELQMPERTSCENCNYRKYTYPWRDDGERDA